MTTTPLAALRASMDDVQESLTALGVANLGPTALAELPSTEIVQQRVMEAACTFDALLARAQRWRTALALVNRLSDELLASIFVMACNAPDVETIWSRMRRYQSTCPNLATMRKSVRLAHVCSRWRRCVLTQPKLWTVVRMPRRVDADVCAHILALSRDLPCDLALPLPSSPLRDISGTDAPIPAMPIPPLVEEIILPLLQANISRITSLALALDDAHEGAIAKTLSLSAPRLARLRVECVARTKIRSPIDLKMPALRHLFLSNVDSSFLRQFPATEITELHASDMTVNIADLGEFLRQNENLRKLHLNNISFASPVLFGPWHLPNLEDLSLAMRADAAVVVRRCIKIFRIPRLALSIDGSYDSGSFGYRSQNSERDGLKWIPFIFSGVEDPHTVKITGSAIEATSSRFYRRFVCGTSETDYANFLKAACLDCGVISHVETLAVDLGTWNRVVDVLQLQIRPTATRFVIDLRCLLERDCLAHLRRGHDEADDLPADLRDTMSKLQRMPCPAVKEVYVEGCSERSISTSSLDCVLDLLDIGQFPLDVLQFINVRVHSDVPSEWGQQYSRRAHHFACRLT
ncbi:hypothetical protein EXIGLDRAFT_829346 [Exidia glandulosa HHB12029]|uniref:Uncharacterized protein n=1 Tax=Exidia glandulosa HHB12029 TaxID=1314781 RepID=A0A165PPC5_EXIGL|nr:hypothetical protein EXIGLDRAFT_829346 [Exidia glandulosa HHB12029]